MARIRHLAIVSENRERLVKFYTEAFGLKVIEGVGPAIYLSDGFINLAIIEKRPHYKEGLYHFGMELDSIEALKPVAKELGVNPKCRNGPPIARPNTAPPIPTAISSIYPSMAGRFRIRFRLLVELGESIL